MMISLGFCLHATSPSTCIPSPFFTAPSAKRFMSTHLRRSFNLSKSCHNVNYQYYRQYHGHRSQHSYHKNQQQRFKSRFNFNAKRWFSSLFTNRVRPVSSVTSWHITQLIRKLSQSTTSSHSKAILPSSSLHQFRQDAFKSKSISYNDNDVDNNETNDLVKSKWDVVLKPIRTVWGTLSLSVRLVFRVVYLGVLFTPTITLFPVWYLYYRPEMTHTSEGHAVSVTSFREVWWLKLLVRTLELAGPTFIKLGQWASSRTDVFPPYACSVLSKLQGNVSPHSFQSTKQILKLQFGRDLEQVFDDFHPDPIGVGAIAQVYQASLKPQATRAVTNNENNQVLFTPRMISELFEQEEEPEGFHSTPCAVKVLHPGVEDLVHMDLSILHAAATVIQLLPGMQWLSPVEEIEAFGNMMENQLDLRNEAANLDVFIEKFKKRPHVSFPKPLRPYVTKEVLVEKFEDGVPMTMFLEYGPTSIDKKLAKLGLDAFLRMLVTDNFVHADLHPGNIYVTFCQKPPLFPSVTRIKYWISQVFPFLFGDELPPPPPKKYNAVTHDIIDQLRYANKEEFHQLVDDITIHKRYIPHLVMLDAGLISVLSEENLVNFLDLFHAIASFDGQLAGKLLIERSKTPETVINRSEFEAKFAQCLSNVKSKTFSLSKVKISEILSEALDNVREHHVKLEGEFVNVVISMLLLEGMGRRLNPDLDLLKSALPVLLEGRNVIMETANSSRSRFGVGDMVFWKALWWSQVGKGWTKFRREWEEKLGWGAETSSSVISNGKISGAN